jgi:hypothetical protein
MILGRKFLLGAAALAIASAASFPNELGMLYRDSYPTTWQQREALSVCQQNSATFVRFLPSDRENCYSRLRSSSVGERTGLWSRHDRTPRQMAQAQR